METINLISLLNECKDILSNIIPKIDIYEIENINNTLFLIIGYKKHTKDIHDSITIDEHGNRVDYEFTERTVIASGLDSDSLIASVKYYNNIINMTIDEYIKKEWK
jgi:hypothetical protein